VQKGMGLTPPLPERLARYLQRPKLSRPMTSRYDDFKQFLLAH
jgi:hypothetical protein